MSKILVATSAEPRAILEDVLKGHELLFAERMAEAERLLESNDLDEIVCTVLFDDSRMFDLLRLAKSKRKWKEIPFVCARMRLNVVDSAIALEGIELAAKALGAAAFLNIADYSSPEGMRKDLERYASNGKGKKTP